MLIIFDLDDTLIDTSGSLTPFKLRAALERLELADSEQALELLLRLNAAAGSARVALSEFAEILGLSQDHHTALIEEVYGDLPEELVVPPLEGALEVLEALRARHTLALVTIGKETQQRLKMERAGITASLFSQIAISEERDKKPHYQRIMEKLGFTPQTTVVCGDRVAIDLAPAKELGCRTIQMQWGRGRLKSGGEEADTVITKLPQLLGLAWLV